MVGCSNSKQNCASLIVFYNFDVLSINELQRQRKANPAQDRLDSAKYKSSRGNGIIENDPDPSDLFPRLFFSFLEPFHGD